MRTGTFAFKDGNMVPYLISLSDGLTILLDKPIMLFGRHEECDVQITSRKISRRHCCMALINNRLLIRDLGSMNGIRVNDHELPESYLKTGDRIMIGDAAYRVVWDEVSSKHGVSDVEQSRVEEESEDLNKSPDPSSDRDPLPPEETQRPTGRHTS